MNNPENLKYTKSHEWVQVIDPLTVRIGLTDFAQNALGDLVFLTLPSLGERVSIGVSFGDAESVKAVSEVYAPVSGVVSAVNSKLLDAPEQVNVSPFDAWLIEVREINGWEELLTASEYGELCAKEK